MHLESCFKIRFQSVANYSVLSIDIYDHDDDEKRNNNNLLITI